VLLLGSLLSARYWAFDALWFAPLLFLVIRPVSVVLGLTGSPTPKSHRRLIAWFGIRGIGSLYYLMYAIQQGLATELAGYLASLVLTVVAASIIVHGISATPLMEHYYQRKVNS
jgi:NhaP-type Na+/H+ or K+/H+ antiporter